MKHDDAMALARRCWSEKADPVTAITLFAERVSAMLPPAALGIIGQDYVNSRAQAFLLRNIPAAKSALHRVIASGLTREPGRCGCVRSNGPSRPVTPFANTFIRPRGKASENTRTSTRRRADGAIVARVELNPIEQTTTVLNASKLPSEALAMLGNEGE